MKTCACAILGVVFSLATSPAIAQTAGQLQQWCRESTRLDAENRNRTEAGLCVGFVAGVAQARGLVVGELNGKGPDWMVRGCVPNGVTNGQLVQVVARFLDTHPESHHLPAASPAWLAISTAFAFQCDR